ncbi:MFS transporter [Actinocatenispora sera]|uniref:MFS transporter n=1 Tax=Actinocatenispora sera TaxID=390989 RepID=UPI003402421D
MLLSAGLVSVTGDWILLTGLAYQVYRLTGSTVASGLAVLAGRAPQLLLGTVAGTLVDRWNRRTTMIVANLLLAAGLTPLLLVRHAGQVWIVYLVLLVETCVEQFFTPAEAALLPRLVVEDELVTANALDGQNRNIARLVGAALGGVAAGLGGLPAVALADLASFLVAAALVALIRTSGALPRTDPEPPLRSWLAGLRLAVREPTVRVVLIFFAVTALGEGVMSTLMAPWVSDVLHGTGRAYGLIMAVQAAGGIVGGVVAATLGHRIGARLLFGAGAVLFGLGDLALFLYPLVAPAVWPAGVLIALVGLPGACVVAGALTVLQTATEDGERGRVFGAVGAVGGLGALLGTVGAGTLGAVLGIVPVIASQGAGYLLAGILVLAALPRRTEPVRPVTAAG